jgi:colicin import membrane protein
MGIDDVAQGCAVEPATKEDDPRRAEEERLYDVPERAAAVEQAPIDAEAAAVTPPQGEAEPAEKKETQWHKAAIQAMRQLTVKAAQPRLAAIAAADAATHRELELAQMRKQRAADEAGARAVQSMQQQQQQAMAAVVQAREEQQRTAAAEALDEAKRREQQREEEKEKAQQRAVAERIEEEQRLHEAELGADDADQGCAVELATKEDDPDAAAAARLYDVLERAAAVEQAPIDAEASAETTRQREAEPAEKKATRWHEAAVEAMRQLKVTAARPLAVAAADAAAHRELELARVLSVQPSLLCRLRVAVLQA